MEQHKCRIVDSEDMVLANEPREGMELIALGPWTVALPKRELEALGEGERGILALGLLYDRAAKENDPNTLYLFVDGNRVVMGIFVEEPFFAVTRTDDLAGAIEEFLRRLYTSGYPYFIERVTLLSPRPVETGPILQQLLLGVRHELVDLEELCSKEGSHQIARTERSQPYRRFIFAAAAILFLFLALYDLYLRYSSERLSRSLSLSLDSQVSLANEKNRIQSEFLRLEAIRPVAAKLQNGADLLSQRVRNLFDLVPDDTYLERFALTKRGVELAGVAAKRESFEEQIDRRLAASYRKEEGRIVEADGKYRFEARYREVRDE